MAFAIGSPADSWNVNPLACRANASLRGGGGPIRWNAQVKVEKRNLVGPRRFLCMLGVAQNIKRALAMICDGSCTNASFTNVTGAGGSRFEHLPPNRMRQARESVIAVLVLWLSA